MCMCVCVCVCEGVEEGERMETMFIFKTTVQPPESFCIKARRQNSTAVQFFF